MLRATADITIIVPTGMQVGGISDEAVTPQVDKNGTTEKFPKTDQDWEAIRIGAVTMAEGAYLLKVRRPFAPPGDENNSTGPEAVELSPAQIMAKVEKDVIGAHNVSPIALQARDIDLLKHWDRIGLRKPEGGIAPDLSNLDEVVRAAREGLGL